MNKVSFYHNSYFSSFLFFIILLLIFYKWELGYYISVQDGKLTKKFNWIFPIAFTLLFWIFWRFFVFPPEYFSGQVPNPVIEETGTHYSLKQMANINKNNIVLDHWV